MARQGKDTERVNKISKINKHDIDSYLDIRQSLSQGIAQRYYRMQLFIDGKAPEGYSKEQYKADQDWFNFWIKELKDPRGALKEIEDEIKSNEESGDKETGTKAPVVSFSPKAVEK